MIEFLLYRYDLISEEWLPLNNSVNAVEMRYGHSLALHKVSSVFQTHFPADFPSSLLLPTPYPRSVLLWEKHSSFRGLSMLSPGCTLVLQGVLGGVS